MLDIAVVQLVSFGDVVISTSLVRAIKSQLNCKLTYYVSSICRGAVDNNPDIDNLVVIPANKDQSWAIFSNIVAQAKTKHQQVFTPWPGFILRPTWKLADRECDVNFMWSYARAGQLAGLKIDVPLKLYLYTTPAEKAKVAQWMSGIKLAKKVVMAEMSGESSQSHCNPEWLRQIVTTVMRKYNNDATVFISAGGPPPSAAVDLVGHYPGKVFYMNHFSLREMSILFNHCDIFLGVSSGTSNACHGHECKRDIDWFETITEPVWDSSPLGVHRKTFHYGGDLGAYLKLLEAKLP